ncbi:protoporphyrinogen oxidase [Uranotaenia lowii]|uniref:protoporphyrinogen oxidase n=1 Tax=Uranotaenia lowii TaxID=190385 RepID=UPI00247B2293|nr:protoporphyrinogen oxidase [Uranotaenia lowii]
MTAILGAGISGLSAGFYLLRNGAGAAPVIYEATNRLGGWIRTERSAEEGYVFEAGPRTIRPKGPAAVNTLELIEEIGLADHVHPIISNHVAAKNRMIYAKGRLNMLPSDLSGVLKTVPPFTKPLYMAGFRDLFARRSKQQLEDESMYSFVDRRFGREIADYAVSSMLCGICAGDAKQISVNFLMKSLFEVEQKHGGVIKGFLKETMAKRQTNQKTKDPLAGLAKKAKSEKWSIYSIQGGLQALPDRLGRVLLENKCNILTERICQKIRFDKNNVQLTFHDQTTVSANQLISSIPSYILAEKLHEQHPELSKMLSSIPFVDVAVINLRYKSDNLLPEQAFGFLVPPIENLPILGVIFDSCCFDMEGNTVLTAMMGGAWFEKWFGSNPSEEQLLQVATEQIGNILNIRQAPDSYKVNLLRKCIPQYVVGHQKRVTQIRDYIADHKLPLGLCGASYDGVGVNDVILSARKCVDRLLNNDKLL